MDTRTKVVFLLLLMNLVFFILFFAGLFSLQDKNPIFAVGIPYLFLDWIVIGLSLASMGFVDYQLYRL
jgi:hypothetical protein